MQQYNPSFYTFYERHFSQVRHLSHPGWGHGSLTCHMTQFERSDWLRSYNFINIMIEWLTNPYGSMWWVQLITSSTKKYCMFKVDIYSIHVMGWLLKWLNLITAPGSVSNEPSSVTWLATKYLKNQCCQLEKSYWNIKYIVTTIYHFGLKSTFHLHTSLS